MAEFLKHTESKLTLTDGNKDLAPSVPNKGNRDTSCWGRATSKVGATGDAAANKGDRTLSALSKASSSVGAMGDNAAKKGTGK